MEDMKKFNILIVDDVPTNIDVLMKTLKKKEYSIFVAPSGKVALELIPKINPDLVLMDVMMPEINGYETCQKIKENPEFKNLPILFITAKADEADIVKGFEMGGVDYIKKPFQQEEVLARIASQIKIVKLIREKETLIRELDSLSRIDPLTRLANRRDIEEALLLEQSRYERYGKPFSILMGDLDNFKQVNDLFGHDAGDYVLKGIAEIIQNNVRKIDKVSRWGGEEILITLPDTPLEGALNTAEKIRSKIEDWTPEYKNHKFKITISFGVACQKDAQLESFLKEADRCLYRAKREGKNRIESN